MATFFGEVILPSSRAFFDDKDDSDNEGEEGETTVSRDSLKVNVRDQSALQLSYDVFIVSDGQIARDFVTNYLVGEKEVVVEFSILPDQELHAETEMIYSKKLSRKPISVATLYKIDFKFLYLDTSKSLQITNSNKVTLNVSSLLEKCKEVVVFASRPLSDYKCDRHESMPQTLVRSLATSSGSLPPSCIHMEQPNFISGSAASVMSWCEVKKMKCLLHVCYTDALFSDSVILAPFLKCIDDTQLTRLLRTKSPDLLKHTNPIHLNVMYQ